MSEEKEMSEIEYEELTPEEAWKRFDWSNKVGFVETLSEQQATIRIPKPPKRADGLWRVKNKFVADGFGVATVKEGRVTRVSYELGWWNDNVQSVDKFEFLDDQPISFDSEETTDERVLQSFRRGLAAGRVEQQTRDKKRGDDE